MSKIRDVVRVDESIPADVIEVTDRMGDRWLQHERGWWCVTAWGTELPRSEVAYLPGDRLPATWGPLTVRAVRPTRLRPGDPVCLNSDLTGVTAITSIRGAAPGSRSYVWERSGDDWRGRVSHRTDTLANLIDGQGDMWVLETEETPAADKLETEKHELSLKLAKAEAELAQWRAVYGENALRQATEILRERDSQRSALSALYAALGVEGTVEALATIETLKHPTVLEPHTVPEGTVELHTEDGTVWTRYLKTGSWTSRHGIYSLPALLEEFGRARIVTAPPVPTPAEDLRAVTAWVDELVAAKRITPSRDIQDALTRLGGALQDGAA